MAGASISIWFGLALVASLAAYALYFADVRCALIAPNRVSWLIWSLATAAEAATYAAVNAGALQGWVFGVSAIACFGVTIGIWRQSAWSRPTHDELACLAICVAALVLWLAMRETFWAHMLLVAAVPVSFWPTWTSIAADRERETSPAWGLWTVSDLATLLVARQTGSHDLGEYAYVVVELLCHAGVWFAIGLPTINPWRKRAGGEASPERFRIGANHLGHAVFAAEPIAAGERLVRFTGRRFRADSVPAQVAGSADRYVQVGADQLMGPSGGIDDLVNHSCAPNAGLRFADDAVWLVAIRAIAPGEELTWDYSTTLHESDWHMICQCRQPECRRVISNFETLPLERQEWFRAHNLVAPYLRRRDETRAA